MEQELKGIQEAVARRVGEGKRFLTCALTEAELIVRGDELATAVKALASEEEAQAATRKAMRDKLTEMQNGINRLAKVVKEKAEERDVLVVRDLVDMAEGPMVRETRTDTGEMLGLRRPTPQEMMPGMM